ncbi:ABC transporter substrate-binding protein [Prosthecomicrobium pneumaticum]|uniref:Iron complex transport system substrate-binding protein n=1 Tax=Prosthecomicrobium pneumaticum TaxID=81895 RepID=A0A7W9L3I0_9HYPH|nr:iron complex transport system substrate-binding protein [Prosthecomicrobium pneumaticum]
MRESPGAPARVVSINACADQLLLALADPGQIAALSLYADDPSLSFLAAEAARFPHDAGPAETVIARRPDLVLAGRYTKRETREMLKRLGFRVVELASVRTIDESIAQIRAVAALIGRAEAGEALVAAIERARAEAAAAAAAHPSRPAVAVYQRRGWVTGGDTLTGELIRLAGFADAGAVLAGRSGGLVPLERMVAAPPDYLLVGEAAGPAEDQGRALLAHPALAALFPPDRRIVLPARLTVCGGPSLPAAIAMLARARQEISVP